MEPGEQDVEKLSGSALVEQAGTPTTQELAADQVKFLAVADRLTRAVKAVDALLCAAIGTRCNPQDFVRHFAGGKESFYLQATGCRKIRGFFGVYMRDRQITVTPEKDGHYTYEVYGIAGSSFFDRMLGTEATGGTQIDVFGSRSSSDPFFSKNDREPDQNDVKKAALANFEARAINGLIGTQNMTRDDLKRYGINVEQVPGIEHKEGAEGGGKTELISDAQRKRMYAIWKSSKIEDGMAQELLSAYGFSPSATVTRDKYEEVVLVLQGGPGSVAKRLANLKAQPEERQPGEEEDSL